MKVFISWSGERSQALAEALRDWLPLVLHFLDPWLSKSDIDAGQRWALEIAKDLEANQCGIICMTRENISSPWILFESGALAKSMEQGRVIPLLLNVEFSDITGPLAQFQAKKVDKPGLSELINSINKMSGQAVPDGRLTQLFEMAWPTLEAKIQQIPNKAPAKHNRPQNEILEELVAGIRGLEMRFRDAMDDDTRSRRQMYSSIFLEKMIYNSKIDRHDPMRYLLVASALKDTIPWIYELGVDAYRTSLEGNPSRHKSAIRRFSAALNLVPLAPEAGIDKGTFVMVRELEHFLRDTEIESDGMRVSSDKPRGQVKPKQNLDDGQ